MAGRIYLDACCLNRPFDDQSQRRVHLETTAIQHIIKAIEEKRMIWIGSDALAYEIHRCPTERRRTSMLALCEYASEKVSIDARLMKRARVLRDHGLRDMDALHLASAERGKATVLLTTDDRFLRATTRLSPPSGVRSVNPAVYATEVS